MAPPRGMKPLSDKQLAVIEAYFENGWDKEKAMLTAGYSPNTSATNTQSVFSRPDVIAEIAAKKARREQVSDINTEWVMQRFARLAMAGESLAKYKKVQPDGSLAWDFTGATQEDLAVITELGVDYYTEGRGKDGIEVKKFRVKVPDMQAALVAIARHLGAFNDSLEVTGDVSAKIAAGRARARARDNADPKESDPDAIH